MCVEQKSQFQISIAALPRNVAHTSQDQHYRKLRWCQSSRARVILTATRPLKPQYSSYIMIFNIFLLLSSFMVWPITSQRLDSTGLDFYMWLYQHVYNSYMYLQYHSLYWWLIVMVVSFQCTYRYQSSPWIQKHEIEEHENSFSSFMSPIRATLTEVSKVWPAGRIQPAKVLNKFCQISVKPTCRDTVNEGNLKEGSNEHIHYLDSI